jgi:hypothetical protein
MGMNRFQYYVDPANKALGIRDEYNPYMLSFLVYIQVRRGDVQAHVVFNAHVFVQRTYCV